LASKKGLQGPLWPSRKIFWLKHCKVVAFAKWLGFRETSQFFFLRNEYGDPTIFLFTSNAAIIFFLCSEYRPVSIVELKTIAENENIASAQKR